MMDNLELYNKVREVPKEAQNPITGGRLKGMTDINPMWRIKTLTEQFGACGIGWYYEIVKEWSETIGDEMVASVEIKLYVKKDGEWSKPISGIGGSKLRSKETKGIYVDDEAYKKASTDAISVACKNLGIGADIYWDKDSDKYIDPKKDNFNNGKSTSDSNASTDSDASARKELRQKIIAYGKEHGMSAHEVATDYKLSDSSSLEELQKAWEDLTREEAKEMKDNFEAIDEDVPWTN